MIKICITNLNICKDKDKGVAFAAAGGLSLLLPVVEFAAAGFEFAASGV